MFDNTWVHESVRGVSLVVKTDPPSFGAVLDYQSKLGTFETDATHVKAIFDLFNLRVQNGEQVSIPLESIAFTDVFQIAKDAMSRLYSDPKESTSGELTEPTQVAAVGDLPRVV